MTAGRQIFRYLVCGAGTTAVNYLTFYGCNSGLQASAALATAAAWLCSVAFAYVTNRRFVFGSGESGNSGGDVRGSNRGSGGTIRREAAAFFGGRAASGMLELAAMVVLVDWLGFPGMWMKLCVSVFVTVLNFVFSKCVVFCQRGQSHVSQTV